MENVNFAKRNLLFVLISFVIMVFSCSSTKGYGKEENWAEKSPQDYLTFTAGNESVTVSLNPNFSAYSGNIQYTTDSTPSGDSSWKQFAPGGQVTLEAGKLMRLRGTGVSTSGLGQNSLFTFSAPVYASGYVDSLRLDSSYTFFNGLTGNCYDSMFNGCDNLMTPPKLGCTEMVLDDGWGNQITAGACYFQMFKDCTSLEEAPALPAEELADSCYASMFNGCTNLKKLPIIGAKKLADNCYNQMFNGCTSLKLSVNYSSENYPNEWKFVATDPERQGVDGFDTGYRWSPMFSTDSFPSNDLLNGAINFDPYLDDGVLTLYSKYPLSDIGTSHEGNANSQDTTIGYINNLEDVVGEFVVEDEPTIDDDGNISEMELKWEDDSSHISSLDSIENIRAYITVWKKQDGSYVASSKMFILNSENGKTMIPSQQMYKSAVAGQVASDGDAVWNDKTPAVYNLKITLVDAA